MRLISKITLILALCVLCWPSIARPQGTIIPFSPQYFTNTSGDPCSGCKLYTYSAGTTTPLATYTTVTLTGGTENANPVVINSGGWPTTGYIYLSATSYKFTLTTSADVVIWTRDNQTAVPTTAGNVDITGTAGEALSAGDLAYLSDGSGALTAGRWYKADADNTYSSTTPQIAFVPTAIASGATGTFRIAGRMTGLSGLTAGTIYYASATAGALTSTAPSNSRLVGQADSTTTLVTDPNPPPPAAAAAPISLVQGRCSLTTAVPVTTADVTAATTLYWALYGGNQIALYTGTTWVTATIAQLSIAVPATTNQMYDVFIDYTAGVPALEVVAWTNDTTRAVALATQNGVYVQTSDTDSRYVCSFRTTGVSGQTEDSFAKRYVWNYYNRLPRAMRVLETANSWAYTTATMRQSNANAANQLDFVIGVDEVALTATAMAFMSNSGGAVGVVTAIGLDSTTVAATGSTIGTNQQAVAGRVFGNAATLRTFPGVGRHIATWLEYSGTGGTTTWYGDDGSPTLIQAGIDGWIEG